MQTRPTGMHSDMALSRKGFMATIGTWIRTLVSRLLLLLLIILFLPFFIVALALPNGWFYKSKIYFWCIDILYRLIVKAALLPVTYKGLENIPQGQELIFASSHQSSLDIPLVGVLVKRYPHIWLATQMLTESWAFRLWLPRIPSALLIDTEQPRKAMRTLLQTIRIAKRNKLHVMIFPEGGRYTDGAVHEFFKGFAMLARRMDRPVVPIRIFGAEKAYPPGSFLVHYSPITVVVGKPFIMQPGESKQAFTERVRAWFLEQKP